MDFLTGITTVFGWIFTSVWTVAVFIVVTLFYYIISSLILSNTFKTIGDGEKAYKAWIPIARTHQIFKSGNLSGNFIFLYLLIVLFFWVPLLGIVLITILALAVAAAFYNIGKKRSQLWGIILAITTFFNPKLFLYIGLFIYNLIYHNTKD